MTISELIERLEALKAEHGDLTVMAYDGGYGGSYLKDVYPEDVYLSTSESFIKVCP